MSKNYIYYLSYTYYICPNIDIEEVGAVDGAGLLKFQKFYNLVHRAFLPM
jgi:hypothetical protein